MSDTTVGITGELAPSDTAVGIRTTDDESTGWVDQLLKVGVQTVLTCGQHHDALNDVTEIADLHIGAVLYRAEKGGDAAGVVVKADLRFGIGAEHLARMVFEQFQKLGRHHEGKRHHLRGLVSGISVHDEVTEALERFNSLIVAAMASVCDRPDFLWALNTL